MAAKRRHPTGIRPRHSRACKRATGGDPCRCAGGPSWEAFVWSKRYGAKISQTFPTQAAAKQWRADALHAQARGRERQPNTTKKTVREALAELIPAMENGSVLSSRDRPYAPSTTRSYARSTGLRPEQREGPVPERLVEAFGEWKLTDLTKHALKAYAGRLRKAGFDPATVNNQLDALRVAYRVARDADELTVDPFKGLKLEKPRGKRERIAEPAEAAELLAALPDKERAAWATLFYAGLRRGELRALQVADIDFAAGMVRVRRGWDDIEGERDGKTDNAERDVPLIGALRGELQRHLMRSGRRGTDLAFGRTAADPFEPSTMRRRAREAWAEAKLSPISPHEARHTYASTQLAAGVPISDVSKWMGHGSIQITVNRYGHLLADAGERAVQRVDEFLAGAAG